LHVDTKRLGRFWEPGKRVLGPAAGRPHGNRRVGWQHLHVAIDDHSRLTYAELLPSQDAQTCARFLERACAWYREQGIAVERVLCDKAKAYHSRAWIAACERLEIARRYTRAYRPPHERQSRTRHPDPPARMGLRPHVSLQRRPRPSASRLPSLVHQTPTAQLARRPTADQPRLTPLWS
jgi:Integrase core domain